MIPLPRGNYGNLFRFFFTVLFPFSKVYLNKTYSVVFWVFVLNNYHVYFLDNLEII